MSSKEGTYHLLVVLIDEIYCLKEPADEWHLCGVFSGYAAGQGHEADVDCRA